LVNSDTAESTQRGKAARTLDRKDEMVANALWRLLDLRGFTNQNHTLAITGKALQESLTKSRVNDRLQESLFLVLELLRAGVLHGDAFEEGPNGPLSGGPNFGTQTDDQCMLLVMRCLGTLPLNARVSS
jgi:hypothetical protein